KPHTQTPPEQSAPSSSAFRCATGCGRTHLRTPLAAAHTPPQHLRPYPSSIAPALSQPVRPEYPTPMLRYALLLAFSAAALAQDVHVKVDPHGPGSNASTTDFTTIQQALDHAPQAPNGRIFI